MEFATSSATVVEATKTVGVEPAQITKTLSFREEKAGVIFIVVTGDAKIDNKKFRQTFEMKARMLAPEEVLEKTGHPIGGVCPFCLEQPLKVYLDVSLQRFETVYPACCSTNSAIALTCAELSQFVSASKWVKETLV